MHPNSLMRALKLGTIESFNCPEGELKQPVDGTKPGESHDDKRAPCFELPPSLDLQPPPEGRRAAALEPEGRRGRPAGQGSRPGRLVATI